MSPECSSGDFFCVWGSPLKTWVFHPQGHHPFPLRAHHHFPIWRHGSGLCLAPFQVEKSIQHARLGGLVCERSIRISCVLSERTCVVVTPWHLEFSWALGEAEVPFRGGRWFLLDPSDPGRVWIQAELSGPTLRCQLTSLFPAPFLAQHGGGTALGLRVLPGGGRW